MTLRFTVLGLELFTLTIEHHGPPTAPAAGRQPSFGSKLRCALAHTVIR